VSILKVVGIGKPEILYTVLKFNTGYLPCEIPIAKFTKAKLDLDPHEIRMFVTPGRNTNPWPL
jgi:hypothetical protein